MPLKKQIELKAQRQQQLIDSARAEHRELTADEQREFENLTIEIKALKSVSEDNSHRRTEDGGEDGDPDPDEGETREAILAQERQRVTQIRLMCQSFKINSKDFEEKGMSVEKAREEIMKQLIEEGSPIAAPIQVKEEAEKFKDAAIDAILIRGSVGVSKPADGARDLIGLSFKDILSKCLDYEGVSEARYMSPTDAFDKFVLGQRQYMTPTAIFPALLDNAIEKAYKEAYSQYPSTFQNWVKIGSLSDFKTHDNYYVAGPAGDLELVPEGGELKHDIPEDKKRPTRKLDTYGKQFTLDRRAFVNDDIGLVARIPSRYAAAAKRTINTQVYSILVNNATIYDGTTLFNSAHRNVLGTGTGVTKEALQKMMLALSTQKDEFDQPIIVIPDAFILPQGLEVDLMTLLESTTINTTDNTQAKNPLTEYAKLKRIVDPTINSLCGGFGNTMPWFVSANQNSCESIEVDFLNGKQDPSIRRMEVAGVLGFVWDIFLDWGISVMDYRGLMKNTGTTIADPL